MGRLPSPSRPDRRHGPTAWTHAPSAGSCWRSLSPVPASPQRPSRSHRDNGYDTTAVPHSDRHPHSDGHPHDPTQPSPRRPDLTPTPTTIVTPTTTPISRPHPRRSSRPHPRRVHHPRRRSPHDDHHDPDNHGPDNEPGDLPAVPDIRPDRVPRNYTVTVEGSVGPGTVGATISSVNWNWGAGDRGPPGPELAHLRREWLVHDHRHRVPERRAVHDQA